MRCVLIAICLTLAGCAARARPAEPPLQTAPPVDLVPADALVRDGCYRCLLMAFDTYEKALDSPPVAARARDGAFVTAVLLAMREKEIGLEATTWLDRASQLATPDEMAYLELVSRLPWTNAGASEDFEPARGSGRSRPEEWRLQASASHAVLNDYVTVAAACSLGSRTLDPATERLLDLSVPIVKYRIGLCGPGQRQHLEEVVSADPRFVEAWFFVGRYEMSQGVSPRGIRLARTAREWLTTAVPPLAAAHDGLPEAPVVTVVFAGLMRARGELERALALYDHALARRPAQRDARLGRTITLTYLQRYAEAIAEASRLIELGTWHTGDAYYWRAWNQYQSGALDAAAADIAEARRLQVNADVMLVSGMIAFDQRRPGDARTDLEASLRMDGAKCAARWYLGFLDVDEERWPGAVDAFATAAECYVAAADVLRDELGALPPDLPLAARQQQTSSYDQSIADSVRQAGRSFFNAAQASMRMGDVVSAAGFARSAVAYESVKARAEALLDDLERR